MAIAGGQSADPVVTAGADLACARRLAAAAQARLAEAAVRYADLRTAADHHHDRSRGARTGPGRPTSGEFATDEVAVVLRQPSWNTRCLLARSRRLAASLPAVWEAFRRGDIDPDQLRIIDRVARRATHPATLTAIDDHAVPAADTNTPKQLGAVLLRLLVQLEPDAFAARHRQALADRRVTIAHTPDGMGYLTIETSAADAAAIDTQLSDLARSLGADDPRTLHQRRADLATDLLLARLHLLDDNPDTDCDTYDGGGGTDDGRDEDRDGEAETTDRADPNEADGITDRFDADPAEPDVPVQPDEPDDPAEPATRGDAAAPTAAITPVESELRKWVEIEDIDPDTGELIGTHWQHVDGDGEPTHPADPDTGSPTGPSAGPSAGLAAGLATGVSAEGVAFRRRPQTVRIGIVVPLSSLLGLTDTPGHLTDRSNGVPADAIRTRIADLLDLDPDSSDPASQVLFTRLLTDDGGRLLDTTELGRTASRRLAEAVQIRAGTCRYPTCTVPAHLCDLDHHQPHPDGPTTGRNQDPACRRHHRGKTFAWLASIRDGDTVTWTLPDANTYNVTDDPLPTGTGLRPDRSPEAG
jgi:hypothetical protein